MPNFRLLIILIMLSIHGCRPPDIVHRNVPVAPDVAVYGSMCMESRDGMEYFDRIYAFPQRKHDVADTLEIIFPDGFSICPADLTLADIKDHSRECNLSDDDGNGNFRAIADDEMHVVFESRKSVRVLVEVPTRSLSKYSLRYNGSEFSLPISRGRLESLIGPPDTIKLDTWPDELRAASP